MAAGADKSADARLRRMAADRGCRLVKSRRRNPEASDYGRYGLLDAETGEKLFGYRRSRVSATADEIEGFLRESAAAQWKRSLGRAARSGGGRGS
jgi:hypothetical protein